MTRTRPTVHHHWKKVHPQKMMATLIRRLPDKGDKQYEKGKITSSWIMQLWIVTLNATCQQTEIDLSKMFFKYVGYLSFAKRKCQLYKDQLRIKHGFFSPRNTACCEKECCLHIDTETAEKRTLFEKGFFPLLHESTPTIRKATLPSKEFLT